MIFDDIDRPLIGCAAILGILVAKLLLLIGGLAVGVWTLRWLGVL